VNGQYERGKYNGVNTWGGGGVGAKLNIDNDTHSIYEVCTLLRSKAVFDGVVLQCAKHQASQFASHVG